MSPLVKTILTFVVIAVGMLITHMIYEHITDSHFGIAFTGGAFTILIVLTITQR